MISEDNVSYITAFRLNEKHLYFDCNKCWYQYREDNNKIVLEDKQGDSREIDAPCYSTVLKYFREEHNILIEVNLAHDYEPIYDGDKRFDYQYSVYNNGSLMITPNEFFNNYNNALDNAINYVLTKIL